MNDLVVDAPHRPSCYKVGAALIGLCLATACAARSPAAAPEAEPPAATATPSSEPEPLPTEPPPTAESCAANPEREQPVADEELGAGPRVVRIINTSQVELRARLVDSGGNPALPGTLRVPAEGSGTFHVGPGTYVVRYRLESSCQVFEGSPVRLTGPRAGVEIALSAIFSEGSSHGVRPINGDL